MGYVKCEDEDTGILVVKEEFSLDFEEVEFEDYTSEEFGDKVRELFHLQNVPADESDLKEFGDEVRELFQLQNVPADKSGPKVSIHENDQELSQIIIKEEIDCDIDNGSLSDLDLLNFADEVPGSTVRRSSRRRCQRFSLDNLLDSSDDEDAADKHGKKLRVRNSHGVCNGHTQILTARSARLPEGGNGSSDRGTVRGKSFEIVCGVCGRGFTRTGYLRRHAATHSRPKPYACSLCEKSFSRSDNLKDHERLHRGENYRCVVCRREFSQVSHLKQHARTHTGERPYRCDVCGKEFRVCGSLRDHERIHTGERPFTCRTCGKSFRQAAHLRVHTRLHTGEKRHGCEVCGKQFVRRTHLKLHVRVHSGHQQRRKKARH